jgi:hypothetical protein
MSVPLMDVGMSLSAFMGLFFFLFLLGCALITNKLRGNNAPLAPDGLFICLVIRMYCIYATVWYVCLLVCMYGMYVCSYARTVCMYVHTHEDNKHACMYVRPQHA